MESQPQNPELRVDPENFHPWKHQVLFRWDCFPASLMNLDEKQCSS